MQSPLLSSHTPTRRRFLQAAVGAVGAPWILPSHVWSAETSANERLNLGVIGCGKMAGGHLRNFVGRKSVRVRAVCDVDTTRREHAKGLVNGAYEDKDCAEYNAFEELLAREDIDAVLIATPDHWHAFIAIAAMRAGKDVYCEKPLTHNVHEALRLIEVANETGRVFQTGSQQRSSAEFRVACELVRNGVIGKVERIEVSFGDPAGPFNLETEEMEPGLDWDRWCGPGPLVGYSSVLSPRGVHNHFPHWRKTREFGGGMITDWGAHHIDIAHWALGEDGKGPIGVRPPENWEKAIRGATLIYPNGVELVHKDGRGVSVFGSEGQVHVHRGKFELVVGGKTQRKFWSKETDTQTSLDREVVLAEREYLKDAKIKLEVSKNHHDNWLECVQTRQKPICSVEIGAGSVIACHLMNFGYWYGADLDWDPVAHQFTRGGDPSWLQREARGAWDVG